MIQFTSGLLFFLCLYSFVLYGTGAILYEFIKSILKIENNYIKTECYNNNSFLSIINDEEFQNICNIFDQSNLIKENQSYFFNYIKFFLQIFIIVILSSQFLLLFLLLFFVINYFISIIRLYMVPY